MTSKNILFALFMSIYPALSLYAMDQLVIEQFLEKQLNEEQASSPLALLPNEVQEAIATLCYHETDEELTARVEQLRKAKEGFSWHDPHMAYCYEKEPNKTPHINRRFEYVASKRRKVVLQQPFEQNPITMDATSNAKSYAELLPTVFSPDGKSLAFLCADRIVYILNIHAPTIKTGALLLKKQEDWNISLQHIAGTKEDLQTTDNKSSNRANEKVVAINHANRRLFWINNFAIANNGDIAFDYKERLFLYSPLLEGLTPTKLPKRLSRRKQMDHVPILTLDALAFNHQGNKLAIGYTESKCDSKSTFPFFVFSHKEWTEIIELKEEASISLGDYFREKQICRRWEGQTD